jgi:hypothetical protein
MTSASFLREPGKLILPGSFEIECKSLLDGNNQINGPGKKITNDYLFEGDFINGEFNRNGHWKRLKDFKEEYKGEFKHNRRHGKGSLNIKDEIEYTGDFLNNKFDGQGQLKIRSIDIDHTYIGQFFNGFKHGQGILDDNLKRFHYETTHRAKEKEFGTISITMKVLGCKELLVILPVGALN